MNVGNTPLIKLSDKLYGKLESVNPGGSIKDRPVKHILDNAEHNGLLKKGDTIIEATSGNTGISLAMMCAERGYKCIIVIPSDMSRERKEMIEYFGSTIIEVPEGDFDEAIETMNEMAKDNGYFQLNQFTNSLNIECHYKTTFQEIYNSSDPLNYVDMVREDSISAFICGTGTGGTLMGFQKGITEHNLNKTKIIAVEPLESPVMSGGEKGLHGIQGIGDGSKFLVDLDKVDEVITISTEEAKERSLRLAKEDGLFVGISSGANVLASERWIEQNNPDGFVFTILCDRGERYLSLFR